MAGCLAGAAAVFSLHHACCVMCMMYLSNLLLNRTASVHVLASDSHAGHCDTVVPTCSCPEITLAAPLFPHTSSSSTPLTSGCKQGQTCGSMEHVWEEGGGSSHWCWAFFFSFLPVRCTHRYDSSFLNQCVLFLFLESRVYARSTKIWFATDRKKGKRLYSVLSPPPSSHLIASVCSVFVASCQPSVFKGLWITAILWEGYRLVVHW